MTISHSHVILDACCIINLAASGHLLAILRSIPGQVAVTQVVKEEELKTLQILEDGENEAAIQFEQGIIQGLAIIVDFESDAEAELFVNYAAVLDDGESATCAIALHRGWAIATDDKKAIALMKREASHLQMFSTLQIIKHWAEKTALDASALRETLNAIRFKGRYLPPKSDPLRGWWEKSLSV
jgi:predicted nucleic acid-binding protein